MTNRIYNKSNIVIIAAIISSLVVLLGGMISGLVLAVRMRQQSAADASKQMAGYLLVDSAYELKNTMSALRLCNEAEPADVLNRTGLVFAVRAETALECHSDNWADSRNKEAFLNDISTVLHTYTPDKTMEMSELLYEYSAKFYTAVANGETFEYNGELIPTSDGEHDTEITDDDIAAAKELVTTALSADRAEYVGDWNGHIELNVVRDGKYGYAVVCGSKIIEFAFVREESGDNTDTETAKQVALDTAEACGYSGLEVKWCEQTGKSISVIMCKNYDGAIACDDYATAVIYGDQTVAFTAGSCDSEHTDIPTPKKTEQQARAATKNGGEGTLVVRKMNGEERICYEYRFELDDGVHYVYVCAESGKQIEVK